jgi:site-specific recombinase XerD
MNIPDLHRQFHHYALLEKGIMANTHKSICASLDMLCKYSSTEKLSELTTPVVKAFLHSGRLERSWSPKTFRNHWQYLKIYFDWCLRNGYIRKNPVDEIEKPKLEKRLPRCLGSEDAKKILYHTQFYPWRYELERVRNHAIICTLMMTGIRLQELLNLEASNVDLTEGDIYVRQGKGRKDRIIPIHPQLLPILRGYWKSRIEAGRPSQWFFTGVKSEKQLQQKDIQRICKKVSISAGVKFSAHILRHTFAREMVDSDFNIYKLKEIMGHAQITTTQIYMSVSRKGIKNSFAKVVLIAKVRMF